MYFYFLKAACIKAKYRLFSIEYKVLIYFHLVVIIFYFLSRYQEYSLYLNIHIFLTVGLTIFHWSQSKLTMGLMAFCCYCLDRQGSYWRIIYSIIMAYYWWDQSRKEFIHAFPKGSSIKGTYSAEILPLVVYFILCWPSLLFYTTIVALTKKFIFPDCYICNYIKKDNFFEN